MHEQQITNEFGSKPAIGSFNLLKVLAMLGMPFVHVLETYYYTGVMTVEQNFPKWVCALTVFGPSVFMLCMGIGISKSTDSRRLRKNGVQMLILNILLNCIRWFLPYVVVVVAGLRPLLELLMQMLGSDILFFVGFFYISYSFIVKRKISSGKLLAISFVMLAVDTLCASFVHLESACFSTLEGHFASVGIDSYFPLFGWSIYPCLGIYIEKEILNQSPHKRNIAFAVIFAIGTAVFALSSILTEGPVWETLFEFAMESTYTPGNAALVFGITLMTISLFYYLYQLIGNNPIDRKLSEMAPLILPFYFVQWVGTAIVTSFAVVAYRIIVGEIFYLSTPLYFLIATAVAATSFLITYKKGFTLSRWLLRVSDYTRYFIVK